MRRALEASPERHHFLRILSGSPARVALLPSSIVGPPHTAKLAPLGAGAGSPPRAWVGNPPSACLPSGIVPNQISSGFEKAVGFPVPPAALPPCAEPPRPPLELACFSLKAPPSTVAKLEMRRQVQLGEANDGSGRYDGLVHDPKDATQPPLLPDGLPLGFCRLPHVDPRFLLPAALMHPSFGQFADEVAALRVEDGDCELVAELIRDGDQGMPYLHPLELGYQRVFSRHYGQFLSSVGLTLSSLESVAGSRDKGGKASLADSSQRVKHQFKMDASVWDKSNTTLLCIMVRPPCSFLPNLKGVGGEGGGGQGRIRFATDSATPRSPCSTCAGEQAL